MELSEPARLLLLASLLAKDGLISHNGKGFLKDLILRRDEDLITTFAGFGSNPNFLEDLHSLIDRESKRLYESLFVGLSLAEGKSLSKAERRRKGLMDNRALIYGEVDFASFATILREIGALTETKIGEIFYDLGSGTGKALYVVQNASVFAGSFLEYDWSDGDCVFANSTCFPEDLMDALARQAEELKPGSIVVTFTKGLDSTAFEVLSKRRFEMSWGPATVFIHRRRLDGEPAPGSSRDGRNHLHRLITAGEADTISTTSGPNGSNTSVLKSNNSGKFRRGTSIGDTILASGRADRAESTLPAASGRDRYENAASRSAGGTRGAAAERHTGGRRGTLAEGLEEVDDGEEDDVEDEEETEEDETEEEQQGQRGDSKDSSQETGLLFDTEQLQGSKGGEDGGVAPPPVPERLVGFGELLRQAEHAQAQALEQLSFSRQELLMMPDGLAHPARATIGDSSDDDSNSNDGDNEGVDPKHSGENEDADDEEEELDDLRDLSDDGSNQEQDEAVEEGEQPSSLWKGGKAESGTEGDKANDKGKDIPGPSELSSDDLKPKKDGKQKRRINPCSDKDQEVDGGESRQEDVASTTRCDSSEGVSAIAPAALTPDTGTSSISHQQQHHKQSEVPADNPVMVERVEDDGQAQHHCMQDSEGEAESCPREEDAEGPSMKDSSATEAMGTSVAETGGDTGVCVGQDGRGHGNGCHAHAGNSDGGDGRNDQRQDETAEGSLQGSGDDDGDDATNGMNARSDGNPDEAVEVLNPANVSTETLLVPPPPAIGSAETDSVISNHGAAAAMKCQWLPITLPPSPPSLGARQMKEEVKPPDPGQGKEVGLVLSPQGEIEALESPQDTALLQRKAGRDPCRN
ncbi:unnamed protein product [Ectocarpus sp. CCAP 1310/34]|nr:unnamed protein product [Ectocarpus sp. CCAP 1310/34]